MSFSQYFNLTMSQGSEKRSILVTSALPYANAPLHLGHILESVQTDIWVRYQNQVGNECLFFCADDTHGTPVMLKAKELGIEAEDLVESVRNCLLYTSPSPRDRTRSRMPSSA